MKEEVYTKAKKALGKMVNVEAMPILARQKTLAETIKEQTWKFH